MAKKKRYGRRFVKRGAAETCSWNQWTHMWRGACGAYSWAKRGPKTGMVCEYCRRKIVVKKVRVTVEVAG